MNAIPPPVLRRPTIVCDAVRNLKTAPDVRDAAVSNRDIRHKAGRAKTIGSAALILGRQYYREARLSESAPAVF